MAQNSNLPILTWLSLFIRKPPLVLDHRVLSTWMNEQGCVKSWNLNSFLGQVISPPPYPWFCTRAFWGPVMRKSLHNAPSPLLKTSLAPPGPYCPLFCTTAFWGPGKAKKHLSKIFHALSIWKHPTKTKLVDSQNDSLFLANNQSPTSKSVWPLLILHKGVLRA